MLGTGTNYGLLLFSTEPPQVILYRVEYMFTYSVSFGKTVEDGEDQFGIAVGIVGEEHAHGVDKHLIEAGGEDWLWQLT
jgi:hypothetical protein